MRSSQARILLLITGLHPVVVAAQAPPVWYVDDDSTCVDNSGNCDAWPCTGCLCGGSWANPFQRIQDAMACTDNLPNASDLTITTEHIWVARGTYLPSYTGSRTGTFMLKNTVQIYGGFVGTESSLSERPLDPDRYAIDPATDSILSGDLLGDDTYKWSCDPQDCPPALPDCCVPCPGEPLGQCNPCGLQCVFTCWFKGGTWRETVPGFPESGECLDPYGLPVTRNTDNAFNVVSAIAGTGQSAVLDGFTVTGGWAEGLPGGQPEPGGGGIRLEGDLFTGGATIRNCAILHNRAQNGGGGVYGIGVLTGSLVDCVIAYNRADHGGGVVGGKGTGTFDIVNCEIVGNVATGETGPPLGGGAYFDLVDLGGGGGPPGLELRIVNTLVALNRAGPVPGGTKDGQGAGIWMAFDAVTLEMNGCTIVGNEIVNSSDAEGGGLYMRDGIARITNSIIWGNKAIGTSTSRGHQVLVDSVDLADITIRYSDVQRFEFGESADVFGLGCPLTIGGACFVEGNLGHLAEHNPLFVDPPSGLEDTQFDLSLQPASPCLDAASNLLVLEDFSDLDDDGDVLERTPLDLLRKPRFVDIPGFESGDRDPNDPLPLVDMGAYERCNSVFVAPPAAPTAGTEASFDKGRYISFVPENTAEDRAFRVTFLDLPVNWGACNGTTAWVGMPQKVSQAGGDGLGDPPGNDWLWVAGLSPTPVFADWSDFTDSRGSKAIHVFGERIVPSHLTTNDPRDLPPPITFALYEIQATGVDPPAETDFSCPLQRRTARWGDVGGQFSTTLGTWLEPDNAVEISDILAFLAGFGTASNAPIKVRTELLGVGAGPVGPIDHVLNVSDLLEILASFTGGAYPFSAGVTCP